MSSGWLPKHRQLFFQIFEEGPNSPPIRRLEMRLPGFEFVNQIHQSFLAAPEPVQFPDHKGIGLAQVGERLS